MKLFNAHHEIKIIGVDPFGCTPELFNLKEKLEVIKTQLNIQSLSSKPVETSTSSTDLKLHKASQLDSSKLILAMDFEQRRNALRSLVKVEEVRDLVDALDLLSTQLSNFVQESVKSSEKKLSNELSQHRICKLVKSLKPLLTDTRLTGQVEHQLLAAVKRCLKCLLTAYAVIYPNKIAYGHPMEYTTFKLLARAEFFYKSLLSSCDNSLPFILSFLRRLEKLAIDKLPLLFMVFAIYPDILTAASRKFLVSLPSADSSAEAIYVSTIRSIFKLIPLLYQFQRNKQEAITITPFSGITELTVASQQIVSSAEEVFKLIEEIVSGLSKSVTLRCSLVNQLKGFCSVLQSESQLFNRSTQKSRIDFAVDIFNIQLSKKARKVSRELKATLDAAKVNGMIEEKHIPSRKLSNVRMQVNDNHNNDEDAEGDEGEGQDEDNFSDSEVDMMPNDLGLFGGLDEMNEEEMMKLAIEMSLQDKGKPVSNSSESGSSQRVSGKDQDGSKIIRRDEGMEVEGLGDQQECAKENDSSSGEIEEMIGEEEDESDVFDFISEQKQATHSISIINFDFCSDLSRVLLRRISSAAQKKSSSLSNDQALLYMPWMILTISKSNTSHTEISLDILNTLFSLMQLISPVSLQVSGTAQLGSEDSKLIILALRALSISLQLNYQNQVKPNATSLESSNDSAAATKYCSESKQNTNIKHKMREEFNRQFKEFEKERNVSFEEKLFEVVNLMVRHFEGSKSSLKIEYANGEVVSVASKYGNQLGTSSSNISTEITGQCQKSAEDFATQVGPMLQLSDQIQFNYIMQILHQLLQLNKDMITGSSHTRWSILLSEVLVSPSTNFLSESRTNHVLQLLMQSKDSFYEIRDRIALNKEGKILARINDDTKQFSSLTYEQLLVLIQSLSRAIAVAEKRRHSWLSFISFNPEIIQVLYNIAFNNVKGGVKLALNLIAIYYAKHDKIQ